MTSISFKFLFNNFNFYILLSSTENKFVLKLKLFIIPFLIIWYFFTWLSHNVNLSNEIKGALRGTFADFNNIVKVLVGGEYRNFPLASARARKYEILTLALNPRTTAWGSGGDHCTIDCSETWSWKQRKQKQNPKRNWNRIFSPFIGPRIWNCCSRWFSFTYFIYLMLNFELEFCSGMDFYWGFAFFRSKKAIAVIPYLSGDNFFRRSTDWVQISNFTIQWSSIFFFHFFPI